MRIDIEDTLYFPKGKKTCGEQSTDPNRGTTTHDRGTDYAAEEKRQESKSILSAVEAVTLDEDDGVGFKEKVQTPVYELRRIRVNLQSF